MVSKYNKQYFGKKKLVMINNEIILSKEQLLKRKNMLLELQKEIKEAEFMLKHPRLVNLKINTKKLTKFFLCFNQLIVPYVLTVGITFGVFSLLGDIPIIVDEKKKYLEIKKEWDNLGNSKTEEQYEDYKDVGIITYYEKWHELNNNYYERRILKYNIGNIEEAIVDKIIKENDIPSLEEIFGNPISIAVENKTNLTEEELEKNSYLKGIVYTKNTNDFIVVNESDVDNFTHTLLWLFITGLINTLTFYGRKYFSSFSYLEAMKKIEDNYQNLNVEELKRKLEIKVDNYKILMR